MRSVSIRVMGFALALGWLSAGIGCATIESFSSYEASATLSIDEAKRVIHRSLEEQPEGYAATEIEITDVKLSFNQRRDRTVIFYFDSLGDMEITKKRKGHRVEVYNSSGFYRFHAVIPDLNRAHRFMDAMLVMSLESQSAL